MNRFIRMSSLLGLPTILFVMPVQAQDAIFLRFNNKTNTTYILQTTSGFIENTDLTTLARHDAGLVILPHKESGVWLNRIWASPANIQIKTSEMFLLYDPITQEVRYLGSLLKAPLASAGRLVTKYYFKETNVVGNWVENHVLTLPDADLGKSSVGLFFTITNDGVTVDMNAKIGS